MAGDGRVAEAAILEVAQGPFADLVVGQCGVIEGDGALEDLADALALGVLAGRPLVELDAGPRGQATERLGEVDPLALHDEAEDVAAQPAAEALPGLASGGDDERGRLLPVEGAEALVAGPGLLERHLLADEVDDVDAALDLSGNACRRGGRSPLD